MNIFLISKVIFKVFCVLSYKMQYFNGKGNNRKPLTFFSFSHYTHNIMVQYKNKCTLTSINICTLESAKQRTCFGQSGVALQQVTFKKPNPSPGQKPTKEKDTVTPLQQKQVHFLAISRVHIFMEVSVLHNVNVLFLPQQWFTVNNL